MEAKEGRRNLEEGINKLEVEERRYVLVVQERPAQQNLSPVQANVATIISHLLWDKKKRWAN